MSWIPSESDEQIAFLEWLAYFHPRIFEVTQHCPNEGKRSWAYGKKLKRLGMSAGFPDIAILVQNKFYAALFLEFKRRDKREEKKKWSQENWLYNLNQNGYLAVYCYTAQEAINITTEYIANMEKRSNDAGIPIEAP